MRFSRVGCWLSRQARRGVRYADTRFKRWTQLPGGHLVTGAIADMTRSKAELIAENAFLRQQLIVLQRQTKRPQLTPWDRALLVWLASRLQRWRQALLIVKPDTLSKWHRQGFHLFWRSRSQPKSRESRIPLQVVALIKEMAVANRLWGAKRIRDERRKLDIRVSKRTVQKYMRQARRGLPPPPAQSDLGDVPRQPYAGHLGVRFPADLRHPVSHHLHLLYHRVGLAARGACRGHARPHRCLGRPAAARGHTVRPGTPLPHPR